MSFSELTQDFCSDASARLDALESDLLAHPAASPDERPALLERIRRVLHTLKGNAGMLGANPLQSALHRLEDLTATPALSAHTCDRLLRAVDVLRAEVARLEAGGAPEAGGEGLVALDEEAGAGPSAAFNVPGEVRLPRARLDELLAATGELVVSHTQLQRLHAEGRLEARAAAHWMDRLGRTSRLLHELVLEARTLPVRTVFDRFARLVYDDAARAGRTARLSVEGEEVQADRVVLEAMGPALLHLVRNAVLHGLEPEDLRAAAGKAPVGTVTLRAVAEGDRIVFSVEDDGRGLDPTAIRARAKQIGAPSHLACEQLIFLPGFSTAQLSEGAGRGVGLDVVARAVAELGGSVAVQSTQGRGTRFLLTVPASLALQRAVLCGIGDDVFAVPAPAIVEAVTCGPSGVRWLGRGRGFDHGGRLLPLVECERTLGCAPKKATYVLVLEAGGRLALPVDALMGQQDFVFQPLDPLVAGAGPANGTALLGDGRVVLRLDPQRLHPEVRA